MKKVHWLLTPLLVIGFGALAATPLPSGGSLQPPPASEAPSSVQPSLVIQPIKSVKSEPDVDADRLKIVLKSLNIIGAQVFSSVELSVVCGFNAGTAYTLKQMREMASRVARHYQDHGYPVVQAYLPVQDINDGALTIAVAEGHYGQVLVRNQSHASSGMVSDVLQDIKTGDLVTQVALESQLLLLSDLPGVKIKSTLVPGAKFGTSDLMVDVLPGRRVSGSIDADSAGNYYTGAQRVGATVFLNEPIGEGDVASLRVLTSGEGLNYSRGAYQLQIGKTRVGMAFSSLEYALGHEFGGLLANGTVRTAGFFGTYPLLRSRQQNLYAGASYESKRFEDRLDSVAYTTEKAAHVLTLSLSGDRLDKVGAGGQSAFSLAFSSGNISLQTASERAFDATTANSNGHFNKLTLNASRLQNLSSSFALYAGVNGQLANKNLNISEKMALGGMFSVRAYPEGEAYGDEAYVLNLEARWTIPQRSKWAVGQLQLVGFIDTGSVKLNKNVWTSEPNRRHLSVAGLGLNWSATDKFLLRLAYAHKLGDEVARSAPDANDRLWLQAIKYF